MPPCPPIGGAPRARTPRTDASCSDPRNFTVAQMTSGTVPDSQAVGRVFCITLDGDQEEMVWTQDDGHLLGALAGTDHEAVWYWWTAVHHNIVFGGPVMPMP